MLTKSVKVQPVEAPAQTCEKDIVIGHLAAGTTITREMVAMMWQDHLRGLPPALYMDGEGRSLFCKVTTEIPDDVTLSVTFGNDTP